MDCLAAATMQGGQCHHLIAAVLRFILCTVFKPLISHYACSKSGSLADPSEPVATAMWSCYSHARYTPHTCMVVWNTRQIAATYVSLSYCLSCSIAFPP
ncbi:hypothetical protein V8C42DRAFT_159279 [Trichoderma barbatum]